MTQLPMAPFPKGGTGGFRSCCGHTHQFVCPQRLRQATNKKPHSPSINGMGLVKKTEPECNYGVAFTL